MNIGAVTVTYSNRAKYFNKVVNRLEKFDRINSIVIVDNGVTRNSIHELRELQNRCKKLTVVSQGYNSGSAKGFKDGILECLKKNVDFIWLIDDDNLPKEGSLQALITYWKKHNPDNHKLYSLLSYRPQRTIYKKAIQNSNMYLMLGTKNSFLGFNFFDKIKELLPKKEQTKPSLVQFGQVAVAPYGGMFFHKSLIEEIGFPDERFFLYADDHDFSYRITKNNGKIILVLDSELEDLETSFHLKKSKKILSTRYFATNSRDAIYYSVRNNVFFEKNFVNRKALYILNKLSYIFILFLTMIINFKHFWKFPVILKAIQDSSNHFNEQN